ncbi:MAG: bifunctional glycosyltransferase family 2 protein/CDP-glycerol:glycerophosphate glycerophosphotransferase [Intrasporangium sp.]|uniref:bifunctional glycosyltransferase/CDP-glycerol:glycerophosphate glycerophosphotransferase n=1 Tax=Intrasporangium sp. TaxID=1925024 RepID=UPI00264853DD|nr:CDP-glycerol glycerophosphotransferase family protein [Intrasporangium sp.]MDN5794479.1 bifunctional glycosyltransferase family 2 protein/CDP-glycerol:glycerophosphate glycerophosphotransferase [Intrasporangium sp.]
MTLSTEAVCAKPDTPVVSVVVIGYNDAANLSRAVGSVLRQSLRAVEVIISDDCSTDDTPELAGALLRSDPRVRYVRQPRNSGGCGVPRNEGMKLARAPFVMFLDSDDELERHACYNLVKMAREEQCDVVSGRCRRHHLQNDTWTTWYPKLYQERRVLLDIEQEPDFLFDSISTNKLYRQSFLEEHQLAFPERVKYEDLQFTAHVYSVVKRFGVIPETVYHWRIYPTDVRRTITHQRSTPQNLADRLHAIRTASGLFVEHDKPALLEGLLGKLLAHDARITVEDAADTDDPELHERLLDLIEPELRAVPREFYQRLSAMARVALGMGLMRNRAGIQQATMASRNRGSLAGRIVRQGDRLLWAPWSTWSAPPAGSLEEFLTDLSHDPIRDTPTPLMRLFHVLDRAERLPVGVRLRGTTHDPLLKFTGRDEWPELTLRIRLRGRRQRQEVPVHLSSVEPGHIRWQVDVPRFSNRDNQLQTRWWLDIRTTGGGLVNDSEICLGAELGGFSFPEPAGATSHLRSRIELYVTRYGDAAFRRARMQGRPAKAARVLHRTDRLWEEANSRSRRIQANIRERAYELARRRPVFKNLVLFDSHMGKQYSDNPRAVYEELVRRNTGLDIVWDFLDPDGHPDYHGRRIKRHSLPYTQALGRAGSIVDNQGLPAWALKRPDQRHVQTWHGTPLKRMALHKLENLHASPETVARITGEAAWDALVSPSDYFERTLVDSYRFTGKLIRGGSPRNDVLINNPDPDPMLVRRLDLPERKSVVLYAPTFRENLRDSRRAADVLLDLGRWIEEMGETHYLLLRSHYLNKFAVKREYAPYLMDVSHVEEISDLYRLSDMLVTDYSSVMFDYIWLDKPIIIYAPDYENYTQDTRGTYFELRDDAPGPFCETQEALHSLVRTAREDQARMTETRRSFRDRYCGDEDGKASARVVDFLLADRQARR